MTEQKHSLPSASPTRHISSLREWDKNPRSITKEGFDRLKKQIQKLGQYKPLLITPDGEVLGGNMRLKAYKELGVEDVWVSVVNPKDENQKLEYALSDNDRAGFYDDDLLANLVPEYPDFDWSGYSVDLKEPTNLQDLLDRFAPVEEDEVPEVSSDPAVSEYGKVYQLGRHRLMCGDATKIEDVEKLMDGQKADMVFTDPPYGMDLDTDWSGVKQRADVDFGKRESKNYSRVIGDDKDYDPSYLFQMFPDVKEMFLWGADYYAERIPEKNRGSWFVWDKRLEAEADKMYGSCFELVWSRNKHKRDMVRVKWAGLFGTETQDIKQRIHPTQKPIELCTWFINKYSQAEQKIIDLFGGSGSTLIACEQTNRTCYMMELDEKYVDVVRRRYHRFVTGSEEGWENGTPAIS